MAICHGPVKQLNRILVGKREAFVGTVSASSTINIFKPDLFGGDKKEGGIVGVADIMFGELAQTENAYLQSQLGTDIPAFRGVLTAVFREGAFTETVVGFLPGGGLGEFIVPIYTSDGDGGFIASMSPYPKPWAFEVLDLPGGTFNPTKQDINNGSANGAHILYDTLTNAEWGLGLPVGELDTASFQAVGDTLFTENFGLSLVYAQQSSVEEFVKQILTLINAVLYPDRVTGKFRLSLIRDDFDPNTLPVFNESNISSLKSFERPAFAELVNEIVLTYRKRGDLDDTTITAQDLASVQAQNGIISQTKDFTGVDTADIAAKIAVRELRQSSTPLARVSFKTDRTGWDVNPGDVIKLSWAAYGIVQVIIRVTEVDYGALEDGEILIEGVEDIFGLPSNAYITPSETEWNEEVVDPLPALSSELMELPFYVIATTFTSGDFAAITDTTTFVQMVARKPLQATFGMQLWTRTGTLVYEFAIDGKWTHSALLTSNLDRIDATAISINTFVGSTSEIRPGGYAYIDDEVLRIDAVDTVLLTITVGRGAFDTVPVAHTAGAVIYFADGNDAVDPFEFAPGITVDGKAVTQTSIGILDIADATEVSQTLVGRQFKPYPPSQVQIHGDLFPAAAGFFPVKVIGAEVIVTWKHQDRLQQVANIEDWFNVALGSQEAGVTYTIRTYNDDTATLLSTDTGITAATFTVVTGQPADTVFNMRVEIEAVRGGEVNFQTFQHIFIYESTNQTPINVTQQTIDVLTDFTP
ncbi:MAG: phage tail protein [Alteromonadaceae bacterium]|nr:phage tail protein [Alteromonadaceae bacterium]MBL4909083.1 phage tail protein [Alteromonadaceae bacterium]MBL4909149.1 phage tail protein [Alteromonadaceae bacterium]